jgi:hypothetical protein
MRRVFVILLLLLCDLAGRVVAQSPTPLPAMPTLRLSPTSTPTPQPMPTPTPTTSVIATQLVTPMPSGYQGIGWLGTTNGLSRAQLAVQIVELLAIVATLCLMHRQHRKDLEQVRLQLNQNIRQKAVELSIERNLQHLLEPKHLPTDLPYWKGLSDEEKRWRVFLLNHLNLLYLVYEDHEQKLADTEDLQIWKSKATWILGDICKAESPGLAEGRAVLQQLLRPEEGVGSSRFRRWLKEEGVVSPDLFPGTEE